MKNKQQPKPPTYADNEVLKSMQSIAREQAKVYGKSMTCQEHKEFLENKNEQY